jgi:hypothetical protein
LYSHCFAKDADKVRDTNGTVLLWSFGNYNVITGRYANAGESDRAIVIMTVLLLVYVVDTA